MDLSLEHALVPEDTVRRHIVAAALRLGGQAGSWDKVHVHDVAREAGVTLEELSRHFADKMRSPTASSTSPTRQCARCRVGPHGVSCRCASGWSA